MMHTAAIIEMDAERDRKICVSLDLKVTGASRELAQWLLDHPRYSAPVVAGWLGCGDTRIKRLRQWAERGCQGAPSNPPSRQVRERRHGADAPLISQGNLVGDTHHVDPDQGEVADPLEVRDNFLDTTNQHISVAGAYKKIFKLSSFASGTTDEINEAINRLIAKWRSVQAILTKGGRHGPS
jgi:hypothetical protein